MLDAAIVFALILCTTDPGDGLLTREVTFLLAAELTLYCDNLMSPEILNILQY